MFRNSNHDLSKKGLLIKIIVTKDSFETQYIPIYRSEDKILKIDNKCNEIRESNQFNEEELKEKYLTYAMKSVVYYMYVLAGWPLPLIWLDKLLNRRLIIHCFNKRKLVFWKNITRCEAHREMLIDGINLLLEKKNK